MPGPRDNAPEFRQGDKLSANKLNAVADTGRRNLASPGMFQSGAVTAHRRMGRGGDDSKYISNLAIVTEAASENGGGGKCIKLDIELQPEVDLSDAEAVTAAEVVFKCAHQYCGCPVNERIQLFYVRGVEHTMFGDFPVDQAFGLLTDCVVELSQRSGFAADTLLRGATAPDAITWVGKMLCEAP